MKHLWNTMLLSSSLDLYESWSCFNQIMWSRAQGRFIWRLIRVAFRIDQIMSCTALGSLHFRFDMFRVRLNQIISPRVPSWSHTNTKQCAIKNQSNDDLYRPWPDYYEDVLCRRRNNEEIILRTPSLIHIKLDSVLIATQANIEL